MHSRLIHIYVAFYHIKLVVQKNRMSSKFDIGSLSIVMTLLICFLLLSLAPKLEAELATVQHAPNPDGSISFLVIGDWGRHGLYNQSQVALQVLIYILYTHMCCSILRSFRWKHRWGESGRRWISILWYRRVITSTITG
jgi:hypothetical protein